LSHDYSTCPPGSIDGVLCVSSSFRVKTGVLGTSVPGTRRTSGCRRWWLRLPAAFRSSPGRSAATRALPERQPWRARPSATLGRSAPAGAPRAHRAGSARTLHRAAHAHRRRVVGIGACASDDDGDHPRRRHDASMFRGRWNANTYRHGTAWAPDRCLRTG